jgi:alpha-galactosidase
MWRISGDIAECFDCEVDHGGWSSWGFMRVLEMREGIRVYSGPDHWNDFDMMEVGNGMTAAEDRAHFSMWCISAAPLIAGNDLRTMSVETKSILTNPEVIAVDQDSLGIQGFRHDVKDSIEFWVKPLAKDEWAVCFLNRSMKPKKLTWDWSTCALKDDFAKRTLDPVQTTFRIRDLWGKKLLGTTRKKLERDILSHDVCMLRLSPATH